MWDYEGLRVEGNYLGDVKVIGRVESSRVKYGGEVVHTVVLDEPMTFKWRSDPSERVLLDHKYITRVMSH